MASVATTDGKRVLVGSKAYDKAVAEGRIAGKGSSKGTSSSSRSSSSSSSRTLSVADQLADIQRQALAISQSISDPNRNRMPSYADTALKSSALLSEQLSDPVKRAQFDALPEDLQGIYVQTMGSLEKAIEAGKVVNPNIEITPAENRKLLQQAEKELEPYYQERLGFLRDDFETSITRLTEDAAKVAERRQGTFEQTLDAAAESEAQSGTAFSSGRQNRERRLVLDEQNSLDDLTTAATRAASDAAQGFERQAGSDALRSLNIPGLSTYQATNRGIVGTGSRSLYTAPNSGALGEINKEKTTAIEGRRSELEDALRRSRILDLSALS